MVTKPTKVICTLFFKKSGQWFNQGREYDIVYGATSKQGNKRYHIQMSDSSEFIPITDRAFNRHFEILKK